MQSEQQQRIMGYFIEEAKDHLNTIEQGLLNLQSTIGDSEMASEVFRAAHSVKGGAAMLGLDSIQKTSHRLEDYFKVLKECPIQVDQKLETLLLRVFDTLQDLLEQLQGPFGLPADKAREMVEEVEPVFDELNQHLSGLVEKAGVSPPADVDLSTRHAVASAESVAATASSSRENSLQHFFQNEVPITLREMLQVFKNAEHPAGRQTLDSMCQRLKQAGDNFDLPEWSSLIDTTQRAIAHPDNTFRTLAPIVIKDLKQAQERVLADRADDIRASDALMELAPVAEPMLDDEIDEFDIDALMADAGVESASDASDVSDLDFASIDLSDSDDFNLAAESLPALEEDDWFTEASAPPDDGSAEGSDLFNELNSDPDESSSSGTEATEATAISSTDQSDYLDASHPINPNGPEVGMAELNSLADLFENEVPELEMTWQDDESTSRFSDGLSDSLEFDESNDFSDLLFDGDEDESDPSNPADVSGDGDVSDLLDRSELESSDSHDTSEDLIDLAALDELADSLDSVLEGSDSEQLDASNPPSGQMSRLDHEGQPESAESADEFNTDFDNLGEFFDELDADELDADELDANTSFNDDSTSSAELDDLDALFNEISDDTDVSPSESFDLPSSEADSLDLSELDSSDWDILDTTDDAVSPVEDPNPELDADLLESEMALDFESPLSDDAADIENPFDAIATEEALAPSDSDTGEPADDSDTDLTSDLWGDRVEEDPNPDNNEPSEFWESGTDSVDTSMAGPVDPADELGSEPAVLETEARSVETDEEGSEESSGEGSDSAIASDRDVTHEFDLDGLDLSDDRISFESDDSSDDEFANLFGETEATSDTEVSADHPSDSSSEDIDLDDLFSSDTSDVARSSDFEDLNLADNLFDDQDALALDFDPDLENISESDEAIAESDLDATGDTVDSFNLDEVSFAPESIDAEQPEDADSLDAAADDLDTLLSTVPDDSDSDRDVSDLDAFFDEQAAELDTGLDTSSGTSDLTQQDVSSHGEDLDAEIGFGDEDDRVDAQAPTDISFFDVYPTEDEADPESDDDFADLEALLEDELPFSGGDSSENFENPASNAEADLMPSLMNSIDDFDDLERLLADADQTLGGPPTSITARRTSPATARRTGRRGMLTDQTMRVSVKHLDNLNNLVGELVVNRNSLEQTQERLRQFLDNLLYQVQQLGDVGQRMRDLYERSLLESSLLSSRRNYQISQSSSSPSSAIHSTGASFDALEMDRFTGFHTLSQEMIELIVRVRESASDIDFVVDESDQITRMFRQVTTQLQEGLTRSRMVPFAQAADRLPRAVRDISIKCGKQAELMIEGRETLIDKMILEQLYDPMTHLVNNAITHGIEPPHERISAGKPPIGRITVRTFHQGNQTVISVTDDGAGINPEKVSQKAVERGLITPDDVKSMSRLDIYDLLFHHGFSTKDKADDFSGRGVGMDVVRTSLNEIRGVINIDSAVGKGTTFTIRLPLTLSISKALLCVSNRARIAFPMDGVEDMLDVPQDRIQTDDQGRSCILWRDILLPFNPLSDLLRYNRTLGRGSVYGGNQEEDIVSVVVLRSAGNFLALQVDQVLGEQEIVIKQLEPPVPKPIGIAGATVLGDGRIMPIADVLELIDLSLGRIRREAGSSLWERDSAQPPAEMPPAKSEPTVLIVDDSITVRELLSMTFSKVGYRVEQARDGQEAWEKLRSGLPCQLVFCDIEMPRMDGLELLSRIQKDPNLKPLPVAMLTSRGADRHRQMAVQLGAKGYFTKPYLEEALLDAAQRMLKGEVLVTSVDETEA
ncbi:MAG: response regulator [Elainellaceae cyanobacterium]